MTSQLFSWGRQGFLEGSIDWDTDDVRVMLVKSTYTFDDNDEFVSDTTPASNDNGRSAALGTKSVTGGVADAADTTLVATAAAQCNALIVYKYNASDTAARLICYIDSATGLPFTPAASQTVSISWDNGANKIFKL
jgi:hypothetical protein